MNTMIKRDADIDHKIEKGELKDSTNFTNMFEGGEEKTATINNSR